MKYNQDLLERALTFCVLAHKEQRDKGEKVYAFHPIRVSQRLDDNFDKICALLHDIVEDTEFTLEDIKENFGWAVSMTVDLLSRRGTETYFEYIDRLKKNPTAVRVKLADLEDNMDVTRGWKIPSGMMKRMMKAKRILEEK